MDIGTLGEDTFKTLCTSVDLVSTPPSKDENGWDSYVEFPLVKEENNTLDNQEIPIRAKVQIKATHDANQKKLAIKLSAMHKLAIEHMPTFICFMHFEGITLKSLFLVHLDEKLIEKILKRVRKAEYKNTKINRQTITIHYTSNNKFKNASGEDLKNEILKYVNGSIEKHIQEKQNMLKTLGFDEQPTELKMTVPALKKDELINKLLINEEQLEVKITSIKEKRFDIVLPAKDENNLLGNAKVSLGRTEEDVKLYVKKHKFDKAIILNMKLRTHPFVNDTFMFYNEVFMIIFKYNIEGKAITPDFKINISYSKEYTFSSLLQYLKFFSMLDNNSDNNLELKFHFLNNKVKPFSLTVSECSKINIDNDIYESCLIIEKIFINLQIDFSLPITINDMLALSDQSSMFYELLVSDITSLKIRSTLNDFLPPQIIESFKIIMPVIFNFNNIVHILILEISTNLEIKVNLDVCATGLSRKILNQFEIPKKEYNYEEIKNELNNTIDKYEYEEYLIYLGNKDIKFILSDERKNEI